MHQRNMAHVNAITPDDVLDLGRRKVIVKIDIGGRGTVLASSKSLGKVTRLAVEPTAMRPFYLGCSSSAVTSLRSCV